MKISGYLLSVLLSISLLLSSCSLFVPAEQPTPTLSNDLVATAVFETLSAPSTPVALAQPTNPALPSDTPLPQNPPIPITGATPVEPTAITENNTANGTCDIGSYVADVTIPDGTVLPPGSSFVKTWRILNSGSCSWDIGYQLIFSSGDLLSAASTVNLPNAVDPGQTVDISVNMVAPTATGTYRGFWKLRNDSGGVFGVGASGNVPVSVVIVVGTPNPIFTLTPQPSSFAISHVGMSVNTSSAKVNCPPGKKFTFIADIAANSAGQATYYWELNDGTRTSEKTINFTSAGTIAVSITWILGSNGPVSSNPFKGWARIYIDRPNHQFFSKQNITLTCRK